MIDNTEKRLLMMAGDVWDNLSKTVQAVDDDDPPDPYVALSCFIRKVKTATAEIERIQDRILSLIHI